jgi:hypothetical protein
VKHLKIIGLAAIAAMALMAVIASSASATALYSGTTKLGAGTELDATLSGTATLTTTENVTLDTCTEGTVGGKTSNAGSATETVKGSVAAASVIWNKCTFTTDTLKGGELEIHWSEGQNGTLTGSGFEVTINTGLFGTCTFTLGTSKVHMGTVTGATTGDATIDINTVATRLSGLCPTTAKWVGTYKITNAAFGGINYTSVHVTNS